MKPRIQNGSLMKCINLFKWWYDAVKTVCEPNKFPGSEAGMAKFFGCIAVIYIPMAIIAIIITMYLLILV